MYDDPNDIINIWPWVTLKGQIQGHSDFEALYMYLYISQLQQQVAALKNDLTK